jgi:Tol biopolymer transport system component
VQTFSAASRVAAAVLITAVVAGCGGHGRAPGTIVFESDRSGRETLYAVRPDGSGLTTLLRLPSEAAVFWTRDGTRALVLSARAYVFDLASRTRREVRLPGFETTTEIAPWSDMLWSPDGKRLAFATDSGKIVVRDIQSGLRRPITEGSSDGAVAWSPDGKRVLFIDWSDLTLDAAPASGGSRTRVTRLPVGIYADALPRWSADGAWISLFNADGGTLYVVHADGTGLDSIASDAQDAAWSPAGARIAFAGHRGIVVVDLDRARRRQLTRDPLDSTVAWSPDGRHILFTRNDLGRGAIGEHHTQLWTMKADGTDQHPVTHAFPDDGSNGPALWVRGAVNGTPVPRLTLVTMRASRTITTRLPIVALAASAGRAAAAQGLGGPHGFRGPLGPIIVWNPVRRTESQIPIPGCGNASEVELEGVFFTAGGVGYRCDNPAVSYGEDDRLRLVRPGKGALEIVHTRDSEFSGTFLGGLAGDGNAVAFDVGVIVTTARDDVRVGRSRIWEGTGARQAIVRTFGGETTVVSLDAGRIAVVRGGHQVSILFPSRGLRTFAFGQGPVLGAVLRGPRLLVLQSARLVAIDLMRGRPVATWPVRRGSGPSPELEDAQGELAAYVVGAAVHILRLSDGREIVIDTPNATGPVFARFVPNGLFYSFNESYEKQPGRLVFVARAELERALALHAPAH